MMPQRRAGDGPTTFASLDAQELPVVREYSAGGLVFDERGRVAIIARHSRNGHLEWCLPKGHIEKGETPQQTAVREVHEETGILGEVVESIATIDYWFTGTSQRVHKLVHHFALRQIGGDLTVEGDPDHEAEDAIWVDFDDLDDVLSYPNERKIAWLYARKMKQDDREQPRARSGRAIVISPNDTPMALLYHHVADMRDAVRRPHGTGRPGTYGDGG